MYLLNRERIKDALLTDDNPEPYAIAGFEIANSERRGLEHSFYYFRLGRDYERMVDGVWRRLRLDDSETLTIASRECVRVESAEHFRLGPRILGLFGGSSTLAQDGLSLLHGPFIDPWFPRTAKQAKTGQTLGSMALKLALVNNLPIPAELEIGQQLGKVTFFDISDTYPISVVGRGQFDREMERRQGD